MRSICAAGSQCDMLGRIDLVIGTAFYVLKSIKDTVLSRPSGGLRCRRLCPADDLLKISQAEFYAASYRAPGSGNVELRINDLNQEGIWSEPVYPLLGLWIANYENSELSREAARAANDWAKETIIDFSPRLLPAAQVSTHDINDGRGM